MFGVLGKHLDEVQAYGFNDMYGLIYMHAHAGPGGVPHNISFMSLNTDSNSRSGSIPARCVGSRPRIEIQR